MNNPIDSREPYTFVSLAKHRSFSVAATELSLTQSAVIHFLRALEEDLGCRLFDRLGKRILLSLARGKAVHPRGREFHPDGEGACRNYQLSERHRSRTRFDIS